jgi:glycosyltransferase involved in cell wall biosynthesis
VVVPFLGKRDEARRLLEALAGLPLAAGDELIVADNTRAGIVDRLAGGSVRVVRATRERSSYHARNSGAGLARNDWLLFMDADCVPAANLLEAYFAEPIGDDCGALGGEIVGDPAPRGLLARYARSRGFLSQADGLLGPDSRAAVTGNVLVRRAAFEGLGGFVEGIRSGGDVDLSRRLVADGWSVEHRPDAIVAHRHRETLIGLLGMIARYGAGARWLNERHPGSSPRWPLLPGLIGTVADVGRLLTRRHLEAALFRAVDGIGLIAHNLGYRASNRAPRRAEIAHAGGSAEPDRQPL